MVLLGSKDIKTGQAHGNSISLPPSPSNLRRHALHGVGPVVYSYMTLAYQPRLVGHHSVRVYVCRAGRQLSIFVSRGFLFLLKMRIAWTAFRSVS